MVIETKYSPGDKLWFMWQDKPMMGYVDRVVAQVKEKARLIEYEMHFRSFLFRNRQVFFESSLYTSKQELINSL